MFEQPNNELHQVGPGRLLVDTNEDEAQVVILDFVEPFKGIDFGQGVEYAFEAMIGLF